MASSSTQWNNWLSKSKYQITRKPMGVVSAFMTKNYCRQLGYISQINLIGYSNIVDLKSLQESESKLPRKLKIPQFTVPSSSHKLRISQPYRKSWLYACNLPPGALTPRSSSNSTLHCFTHILSPLKYHPGSIPAQHCIKMKLFPVLCCGTDFSKKCCIKNEIFTGNNNIFSGKIREQSGKKSFPNFVWPRSNFKWNILQLQNGIQSHRGEWLNISDYIYNLYVKYQHSR